MSKNTNDRVDLLLQSDECNNNRSPRGSCCSASTVTSIYGSPMSSFYESPCSPISSSSAYATPAAASPASPATPSSFSSPWLSVPTSAASTSPSDGGGGHRRSQSLRSSFGRRRQSAVLVIVRFELTFPYTRLLLHLSFS